MRTKSSLIGCWLLAMLTMITSSMTIDGRAQTDNKRGLSVKVKAQDGAEIELYGESHALVIGVSEYRNGIRNLPGVERDIVEVKAVLERHGFDVKLLPNPTRKKFDDEINAFIDDFGQSPTNRLLIYFAGHGSTMTLPDGREMGYILPGDVPRPTDAAGFKRIAISMDAIDGYARRIEAKHALFVFDSCFSGSLFKALRPLDVLPVISAKVALPVRQFITAGTAEQSVPDQSMFSTQFVAGLNGEADLNSDGYVTVTELAMFIEDKVTNYSKSAQTPRYGKIRDPKLDQGDMVFVLPKRQQKAAAPASVPLPPISTPAGSQPIRQPAIEIATVPTYSPVGGPVKQEQIAGAVSGVEDPTKYRVVIYALTNHWWVQPFADASLTEIDSDGKWSTQSHLGARYAALLVKPSFDPPGESQALPAIGGMVLASTTVTGKKK